MKLSIFLIVALLLAGCNQKNSSQHTQNPTTQSTTKPTDNNAAAGQVEVIATYKDLQVYAAMTRYVFENPKGDAINVDVPHQGAANPIKLPANLGQPQANGPMGPNPQMLGRRFRLIYQNGYSTVAEILPEL